MAKREARAQATQTARRQRTTEQTARRQRTTEHDEVLLDAKRNLKAPSGDCFVEILELTRKTCLRAQNACDDSQLRDKVFVDVPPAAMTAAFKTLGFARETLRLMMIETD